MPVERNRESNKRGFGVLLREEILAAADRLLTESGTGEAVTLRAIAREANIAAPSIYPHFPNRDAILDAVVDRTFTLLATACREASEGLTDGRTRVEAISLAYVDFAREHPGKYRTLFERSAPNIASPPHPYPAGIQAFDLLVQALTAAEFGTRSSGVDVQARAQTLFATLHGIAVLPPALPGFPWAPQTTLTRLAASQACRAHSEPESNA